MDGENDGKREGYCKSCNAPIVWVKGEEPNKWHICNPGRRMFVHGGAGFFAIRECYESHFATCKDAEAWRKKKVDAPLTGLQRRPSTKFTME